MNDDPDRFVWLGLLAVFVLEFVAGLAGLVQHIKEFGL